MAQQTVQALAENVGGNSFRRRHEFLEPRLPEQEVANYQERPAVPEEIQTTGDRTRRPAVCRFLPGLLSSSHQANWTSKFTCVQQVIYFFFASMEIQTRKSIPKLAPPGAGLPWLELIILRLVFGFLRRRTTREQAAALVAEERDVILKLARRCDPESGSRCVLIDRLRGMEDSSRFWSVFMTLDHLRIVNRAISEVIRLLGRGQIPARQVSIADLKPSPQADQSVIVEFEKSCERLERRASELPDLRTAQRYAHPWFGPLDAAGWHFLAGFHMQLHRRQIERILCDLSLDKS
jgi:hypothetical protein